MNWLKTLDKVLEDTNITLRLKHHEIASLVTTILNSTARAGEIEYDRQRIPIKSNFENNSNLSLYDNDLFYEKYKSPFIARL